MAEEILPNLYRINIPLPGNPLRSINSYVVKGEDRTLIIDTGLNRKECLDAIYAGLNDIGVDLNKVDFYITHNHSDHNALVPTLAHDSSTIFIGRPDKEFMENWNGWEGVASFAGLNGFPETELRVAIKNHPGYKYGSDRILAMTAVDDGDELQYGDYYFKVISTPGHTMGHTCLYEPRQKLLVSGDHILFDITPNITCFFEGENPLKDYITSLDKVYTLPIDLVLPGHRRLVENPRARINELKEHHRIRNEEILAILQQGPKSAYETASLMSWDIDSESWEEFPVAQKWFASGETIAHLTYLEGNGQVVREMRDGCFVFLL